MTVHATVSEFWHVLSGWGEIWRRDESGEEVTVLTPGVSIDIPVGTAFQYRCTGAEALRFLCIAMPPWPGDARKPTSKVRGCRQRQSARCLPPPHSEADFGGETRREAFLSASANVFDDLNQLVQTVALAASELDELSRTLHDGTPLGRPGNRDATPAPELQQPLVTQQA